MAFDLKHTEDFLIRQEQEVVPKIQEILTKNRRNATARLYNSINFTIQDKPNNTGFEIYLDYANHGNFVLDNRRNVRKAGPSREAIASIMNWISNKGISIGAGKIRSVQGTTQAQSKSTKPDAITMRKNFAFAIWYNIKKKGRTTAPSTNFLKPWNNLYKSSEFQEGLTHAIAMDLGAQIKPLFQDSKININM